MKRRDIYSVVSKGTSLLRKTIPKPCISQTDTRKYNCCVQNCNSILPHIIKALKNNINPEAYAKIQAIVSDENKSKFISDLKMLKENDSDYRNVDINGYWKLVKREASKILR